jgi:hypothetical protein
MSSADDVSEMVTLSTELADRLAGHGAAMKQRIGAVADAVGVTTNRALEFMKGKARRVDAWEKEHAKRRVAELRDAERRQRERAHLLWLESELGRLQSSGEEFHGAHVDGLQHFLRVVRGEAGAVAVPDAAEDHDQSVEWGGYQPDLFD